MDPQTCFDEMIRCHEAAKREPGLPQVNVLRQRALERFQELLDWTRDGGYEPRWPQRPLTHDERAELEASGHRP